MINYNNYLIATLLTIFVGSIFIPSISMQDQGTNSNHHPLDKSGRIKAKFLINCFCTVRVKEGQTEKTLNGLEYYLQESDEKRSEPLDSSKRAMKKLMKHYSRIDKKDPDKKIRRYLYYQTMSRNANNDSLGMDFVVRQILATLTNIEGIEEETAEEAFSSNLKDIFGIDGSLNKQINEIQQKRNIFNQNPYPLDNSLIDKVWSFLRKPTFIYLGIATVVASYLIYRRFK